MDVEERGLSGQLSLFPHKGRVVHRERMMRQYRSAVRRQVMEACRLPAPCELCGAPATQRDHFPVSFRQLVRRFVRKYGALPTDAFRAFHAEHAGLRPLCLGCHKAHSRSQYGRPTPGWVRGTAAYRRGRGWKDEDVGKGNDGEEVER